MKNYHYLWFAQNFFPFIMPHIYLLSLFFFSMDHILSPQTYVAFASHYDKYKAPTFFYRSYVALGLQVKKAVLGKATQHSSDVTAGSNWLALS